MRMFGFNRTERLTTPAWSIASVLYEGSHNKFGRNSVHPETLITYGEYYFDETGVWERGAHDVLSHTPTSEWVGGLAVACQREIPDNEVGDITYALGQMVAEGRRG